MNIKSRGIERNRKNVKCRNYNFIYLGWFKLFLESMLSIELEDMLSHSVHKLVVNLKMDLLNMWDNRCNT
jgi:hypothetical protein